MREIPIKSSLLSRYFIKWQGITIVLGVVLALIGPYGTYVDLPFLERLAYWVGIAFLNALQITVGIKISKHYLGKRMPLLGVQILGCLFASVPAFIEILLLEHFFRDLPLDQLSLFTLSTIYFYVALLTIAIGVGIDWATMHLSPDGITPVSTDSASSEFYGRIPTKIQGELLALSAEDHYLRIYTPQGSDLILMRLSDAVDELKGVDGMQVHRSHWVAAAAITATKRDKGRVLLLLKNDVEIPVSRGYLKRVREANWLE